MDSLNLVQDLATSTKIDHGFNAALSSLPPTPSKSATAFTIEFDDMNNNLLKNNQKKHNFERGNSLRDSLRKYAPEKLDKLTKPKPKDEDTKQCVNNNSSKKMNAKGNLNYSTGAVVENHLDRNLSDGAAFLIRKMFGQKASSSAVKLNNKLSNNSIKTNQLDNRLSSSCKSSPLKLKSFNFNNNNNTSTSNGSFVKSPGVEMDSGVCEENVIDDDALSETGTYTIELDNQDPIAEEARKRINEIFGAKEGKPQLDSLSSSSNSLKASSKQSFKISSIKRVFSQDDSNRTRHNSERGSTLQKNANNSNSSTERLSFRDRRSSLQQSSLKRQDSFSKSSTCKLSTNNNKSTGKPPVSSTNNNKKSQLNQNINLINQNNTFVFNCPANNSNSNSLLNRARANSITRSSTTKKKTTRKDQLKIDDDTGSIRSEEDASTAGSTDLSSLNSEKCKSDNGQTASSLRFNRAFALRRARLGIDTPPPTVHDVKNKQQKTTTNSNNKLTNHQSNKPNSSQISHIPITSFDRSDGGRYSLRASSSNFKPPINGQSSRLAIASRSKQLSNQQTTNSNSSLNRHETSSLINTISATKNKMVNKMTKNNSFVIEDVDQLRSHHVRANSFGSGQLANLTVVGKPPRLSSAASTSSNNTMSNASTSEDLSNISDQMNVKGLQHLSPFQLGRRIYSTKPVHMAQTNSFRSKLGENGNLYMNGGSNELAICDQPQSSLSIELPTSLCLAEPKKKFGQLSTSSTPQPTANFNLNNSNSKSLSALDYLVLSAVHQLSFKLRCKLRTILDVEKNKYPFDNENRILIEELLPQVNVAEYRNSETSEKTISRDLSNVLKNLKRIEQSLEVINLLLESNNLMKSEENSTNDDILSKDTFLTNDDQFSLEI